MTAPVRVQQRRSKGWRKPENTVSVARPSKWGNPFRLGETMRITVNGQPSGEFVLADPAMAVALFRRYLEHYQVSVSDLAGKNLMCFCPLGQPCHADVLLELANAPAEAAVTS